MSFETLAGRYAALVQKGRTSDNTVDTKENLDLKFVNNFYRNPKNTTEGYSTLDASPARGSVSQNTAGLLGESRVVGGRTFDRLRSEYLEPTPSGDNGIVKTSMSQLTPVRSKLTNIQDVYNLITSDQSAVTGPNVIDYSTVDKTDAPKDIIKFAFRHTDTSGYTVVPTEAATGRVSTATPGQLPAVTAFAGRSAPLIRFRAFLKSMRENIKPEFNEQRYVGRTERFVTYGGVKRTVDLQFNIVAFSEDEADGMWTKVNYLSGLAFPKGVQNGFMVPPLFTVSVGGFYDNQPCYIETLDYTFVEEGTTFDIDKEVPFLITTTMRLSILEKRSKFYNSPFYKITENIAIPAASITP
jgi:hypothetical protein